MSKIVVVGLGYVGLPLAVKASEANFQVTGIEIDKSKVSSISLGRTADSNEPDQQIITLLKNGNLKLSTSFDAVSTADVVIICVPTPLDEKRKPNLSYIEKAAVSIAKNLKKGTLIILESTVQPGTTRNFLIPLVEQNSSVLISDLDIAYSPERIDPFNEKWSIINTPKVISGINRKATNRAYEFYSKFIGEIVEAPSIEVAEMSKLLENSFRFINISFVNEFAILCENLGINVLEVIETAATKPYGFMPFYPGLGAGGHCIPVDSIYLLDLAKKNNTQSRFIELAAVVNDEMPVHFVRKSVELLGTLQKKRILVIGVTYKPNVADVRETPVEGLILGLRKLGAQVFWHDELVKEWNGETSSSLSDNYDLAILATPHSNLYLQQLGDTPIIHTRRFSK